MVLAAVWPGPMGLLSNRSNSANAIEWIFLSLSFLLVAAPKLPSGRLYAVNVYTIKQMPNTSQFYMYILK